MSLISKEINGYKLLRLIGSGGMGEVYYAFHSGLRREAAVKVLYQSEMADRFKNEAYIQASVQHPNIAALYEYGMVAGNPCIVMEFINGETLENFVQRRPLLKTEAVTAIFTQVCEAVSFLHSKGIQHRDLKPSNIKITEEGKIKLLDFGISKSQYTPKLTKEGYIVGTTDYMAPEQFRGKNSIQSDIWAMGILLYFMTTKHLPFFDQSIVEQRRNVEQGIFIKPAILNPEISSKHQRLIAQMLSPRPGKRPLIDEVISGLLERTGEINISQLPEINNAFFRQNKVCFTVVGLVVLLGFGLWITEAKPDVVNYQPVEQTVLLPPTALKVRKVEVVVQNSNQTHLVLPNKKVIYKRPFIVEIPEGKPFNIELVEGKFSKKITINADFKGERFMCTMDY